MLTFFDGSELAMFAFFSILDVYKLTYTHTHIHTHTYTHNTHTYTQVQIRGFLWVSLFLTHTPHTHRHTHTHTHTFMCTPRLTQTKRPVSQRVLNLFPPVRGVDHVWIRCVVR